MKQKVRQILKDKSGALAENEVKDLLSQYDITTTTYYVVREKNDVESLTPRFPVALKVCSSRILHKTDVDGVRLNIDTMDELLAVFDDFKLRFPEERFLVDEMVEKGIEAIVGLVQDPTFGLCIMCGVGGVFTELYQDVSFRVVPIEPVDTDEMIAELQGKKLFEGFRNIKVDRKAFSDLLMKVSRIGEELIDVVDQMDLNPVFLYEEGYCVVDAKVVLKEEGK
jgi:succinyl-CoA synthetase beta subunit